MWYLDGRAVHCGHSGGLFIYFCLFMLWNIKSCMCTVRSGAFLVYIIASRICPFIPFLALFWSQKYVSKPLLHILALPHTVPECSAAVGCLYRLFPHWHLMMILILGSPPPPDQTRCLHHGRDAGMELLCIMRAVTRPGSRSGPGININYGISRQLYQHLKSQ